MPKKKSQAIDRTVKSEKRSQMPPVPAKPLVIEDDLSKFPAFFENKAGRYELIRVQDGQAFYSFTNHLKKTVDATMPLVTWRKMQDRAQAALKESA